MFMRMHCRHIFSGSLTIWAKRITLTSQWSQPGLLSFTWTRWGFRFLFFVCDSAECSSKILSQGSGFCVASKSPSWAFGSVWQINGLLFGYWQRGQGGRERRTPQFLSTKALCKSFGPSWVIVRMCWTRPWPLSNCWAGTVASICDPQIMAASELYQHMNLEKDTSVCQPV